MTTDTTKLLHFSDVHLTAKPLGWSPRDLFSKRVGGWVNVRLLGRGKSFRHAPRVVEALRAAVASAAPDALVFSGDATGMGFESECAVAAAALGVADPTTPPAVAVPGNHDYYTRRAIRRATFEAAFAPWLAGVRVDEHPYPFARKVGHVWLVCANSSTANRWHWDSAGAVGPAQMARLVDLCAMLDDGPRILVTHYPLRTAEGLVEPKVHGLRDHRAMLELASRLGVAAWLHGHIHKPFARPADADVPFPLFCAGSATQTNRWSVGEYEVRGDREIAWRRHVYRPESGRYEPEVEGVFELGGRLVS